MLIGRVPPRHRHRGRRGGSADERLRSTRWLLRLVLGAVLIVALVVGGTGFRVWQVARVDDRSPVDVVMVLGAAQYNGEPSEVLGARLDHGARLWRAGVAPVIATVGGALPGDAYTEAEAGRMYLLSYGIPAEAVVAVGEGSDTLSSVRAIAEHAKVSGWSSAVIVSDPGHSLRARTMARDTGLAVQVSPTRSGPVVQTRQIQGRYIVRETAALIYYKLTHGSAESLGTDLG
ncbi:MAG: YdcF family protein [Actinomycetota bacterium]|nr:YdcF family protein [Actinomycetota bacterium]